MGKLRDTHTCIRQLTGQLAPNSLDFSQFALSVYVTSFVAKSTLLTLMIQDVDHEPNPAEVCFVRLLALDKSGRNKWAINHLPKTVATSTRPVF